VRYPISFVICVVLSIAILCGCKNQPLYKETRIALGTYVEVTSCDKRAPGIVFKEISRIENLLSKYNPESEIFKLNKSGKLKVSPETFYIIKKSKDFWKLSNGAFDITVAPLMDLWGFTNKQYSVPKDEQIKNTLKLVGSEKIILQEVDNIVEFSLPGMKVDLGGIAKGYALDCVAKKLKENGITSCLISAGQIYALGKNFGRPWKIAIKNPRGNGFDSYLEIEDQSVATSGDYQRYFAKSGKRYSHIMNPLTGFPADSGITSVTVIAKDGLTADALATAVFVLGKNEGGKLSQEFPEAQIKFAE